MRCLFALGLLIALCASADAATSAPAVRHKPNARTYGLHRSMPVARSRFLHRNYGNPDGATSVSAGGYMWNGRSASEWGGG
jgi:hypothetical protein